LGPLFDLAKTAWGLASLFIAEQGKIGVGRSHYFNWCMAAVFAKQMRLFVANYRLCEGGLGLEALSLCRAMFETFVNLKALSQSNDQEEYARLWMIWDFANDERMAHKIIDNHPDGKAKLNELGASLAAEKAKIGENRWKVFVDHGPSQLNLRALCDKIELTDAYKVFYPLASGAAHGYDLVSYARPISDDQIQTNLSPTLDFVDTNLATSIAVVRDTLAILNHLLSLNKEKELADLTKVVEAANTFINKRQKGTTV